MVLIRLGFFCATPENISTEASSEILRFFPIHSLMQTEVIAPPLVSGVVLQTEKEKERVSL